MSIKTKVKTTCKNCGQNIEVKLSRFSKFDNHYCSRECYYAGRKKDIESQKKKIISLYKGGLNVLEISKKLELHYGRLCYHFHRWNINIRKCSDYPDIMNEIGLKRRKLTEKKFLNRYKKGEISWRRTHTIASRLWRITDKPCEVCGWKEVERDMHLMIPKLLKKDNAVSLCPNCHRLVHRGKIKLSRKKGKLIIKKI